MATATQVTKPAAPAPKPQARPARKSTPVWLWEAKSKQGDVKKGEMEANDQTTVEARLKSIGLAPTKVRRKSFLDAGISIPGFGGVGGRDILIFTRQFATMIDAGLPLVQCLDILGSQTDNLSFRKVIFAIKTKVEGGSTFSDALKDHPKIFDELFVQLCAAGEVGGILDTILNRLAQYREKAEKLKRKVKGAMVYPTIVIVVAVAVTAVLLLKVTPVFAKMFADFGSALPAPTQFVVDMSDWLQKYILYLVGGIIAFLVIATWIYRNPTGRRVV
ncbi:MAG: pilC, partial [Myxococcaceae bacterium]|nr:pilC [Myxococcaceae bacterium]